MNLDELRRLKQERNWMSLNVAYDIARTSLTSISCGFVVQQVVQQAAVMSSFPFTRIVYFKLNVSNCYGL